MNQLSDHINELKAAEAFSRQSFVFDREYSGNAIIQYKRKRVREHFLSALAPRCSILELNCGTGDDALFFAQHGHDVYATDIAEGMIARLNEKKSATTVGEKIKTEICSFTELDNLKNKGPFDAIFSNFGGLNCTGELEKVLASFPALVKAGGIVTLVIIPKFCLWETLLLFKGKFKTATRRFFSSNGRKAHIEGVHFKCWYYNPRDVISYLGKDFELEKLEGLCTIVPPSYMEGFAEKHPALYRWLIKKEDRLKATWPWNRIGDYFIITLRKRN